MVYTYMHVIVLRDTMDIKHSLISAVYAFVTSFRLPLKL